MTLRMILCRKKRSAAVYTILWDFAPDFTGPDLEMNLKKVFFFLK